MLVHQKRKILKADLYLKKNISTTGNSNSKGAKYAKMDSMPMIPSGNSGRKAFKENEN